MCVWLRERRQERLAPSFIRLIFETKWSDKCRVVMTDAKEFIVLMGPLGFALMFCCSMLGW